MSPSDPAPVLSGRPHAANRILAALPDDEARALLSGMTEVRLRRFDVLAEESDKYNHVYFPHDCLISLVVTMSDGKTVETMAVGSDGCIGFDLNGRAPARNVAMVGGTALRIERDVLAGAMAAGSVLKRVMEAYQGGVLVRALRVAACCAVHSLEARAARWLLSAQDATGQDSFQLTQEIFAELLGVRRASVNQVSRGFQRSGAVEYSRGSIRIINRRGLERVTCECYHSVRTLTDDVFA